TRSSADNVCRLNCGLCRERGMLRTSMTRLMPCTRSSSRKTFHVRVECPIVKTSSIFDYDPCCIRSKTKSFVPARATEAANDEDKQVTSNVLSAEIIINSPEPSG